MSSITKPRRTPYGPFMNFLCLVSLPELTLPEEDWERVLRRSQEQVVSTIRPAMEQSGQLGEWIETGRSRRPRRFAVGDRTVDLERHLVTFGDFHFPLTQLECRLLDRMWVRPNRTIPSERLVHVLWGRDARRGTHSLRSVVRNVRRKLEPDPSHPRYLLLDRTIGYRLSLS